MGIKALQKVQEIDMHGSEPSNLLPVTIFGRVGKNLESWDQCV